MANASVGILTKLGTLDILQGHTAAKCRSSSVRNVTFASSIYRMTFGMVCSRLCYHRRWFSGSISVNQYPNKGILTSPRGNLQGNPGIETNHAGTADLCNRAKLSVASALATFHSSDQAHWVPFTAVSDIKSSSYSSTSQVPH